MKIKVKEISYDKFLELPGYKHVNPKKRSFLLASIIRLVSEFTMMNVKFKANYINMDKIDKKEPYLMVLLLSTIVFND